MIYCQPHLIALMVTAKNDRKIRTISKIDFDPNFIWLRREHLAFRNRSTQIDPIFDWRQSVDQTSSLVRQLYSFEDFLFRSPLLRIEIPTRKFLR